MEGKIVFEGMCENCMCADLHVETHQLYQNNKRYHTVYNLACSHE